MLVHCVHNCGTFFDIFKAIPDKVSRIPCIMLHSYSVSKYSLSALLKISKRVFVSVSLVVSMKSPKWRQWIHIVPIDRLLIESDIDDDSLVDEYLQETVKLIAEALRIDEKLLVDRLQENSGNFFTFQQIS